VKPGDKHAGPRRDYGFSTIASQTHAFLLTSITVAEDPDSGTLTLVDTGIIGLRLMCRRKHRPRKSFQISIASTLERSPIRLNRAPQSMVACVAGFAAAACST
jgi:hypothetical protein